MIKDLNRYKVNKGEIFHFQHSLRPFISIDDTGEDTYFLDINECRFYTRYETEEIEGLSFYTDEDDDDFMGVDVIGKLEW